MISPYLPAIQLRNSDALRPGAATRRASEESPSSTDLGMDTLVCALNGHEPISCSSSATPRLGASSSTKCEMSFRDSRISDEYWGRSSDRRPRHESGVMKGCVTYNTPNPFRPHPKTHPHSQCWSSSPRNVFRTIWSHRIPAGKCQFPVSGFQLPSSRCVCHAVIMHASLLQYSRFDRTPGDFYRN